MLRDARVFAEALFAGPQGPPPRERLDWLMTELEDFTAQAGAQARLLLRGGLMAASWLAPPLIGKAPPLARLSISDRCHALEKLERTPAGLPLLAVKAMLCILYYEHPDVLRETGVTQGEQPGPACLREVKR